MSSTPIEPTDGRMGQTVTSQLGLAADSAPASTTTPQLRSVRRLVLHHFLTVAPWVVFGCAVFGIVATWQNGEIGDDASYCEWSFKFPRVHSTFDRPCLWPPHTDVVAS